MAWSQSLTETTAENSGELGSSRAVLGLDAKQWKDREMVSTGPWIAKKRVWFLKQLSSTIRESKDKTLCLVKLVVLYTATYINARNFTKCKVIGQIFLRMNLTLGFYFCFQCSIWTTKSLTISTSDTTVYRKCFYFKKQRRRQCWKALSLLGLYLTGSNARPCQSCMCRTSARQL